MTGKFTERPLDLTLTPFNDPFEDHFRTPGHVKAGQRRGSDGIRALAQRASHLIFRLIVFQRRGAHQGNNRVVTEGNGDRQIFPTLFRFVQMQRDIVHRYRLQAELALAFHFHAVDTDVLLTEVIFIQRIARNDTGFIEVETAVTIVEAEQRQNIEQVDIIAINSIFCPRRVGAALWRHREVIPAANELINLLFHRRVRRQAQRDGMVLPRADGVHRHASVVKAANIIEPQRRGTVADASGRIGGRRQIGLSVHLFTDFQQLSLVIQRLQKAAQIIKSHYSISCANCSAVRKPFQRRAL